MRAGKPIAQRLAVFACAVAFGLSGCSGSVTVRSGFSGAHGGAPASAPSAPAAPVKAGQGLHAAWGSSHLGWVILAGLVVAEVVHWTALKLRQSFAAEEALASQASDPNAPAPAPPKCVHPVPAMC